MKHIAFVVAFVALIIAAALPGKTVVNAAGAAAWDVKGAATYLDARQDWWRQWPSAARDHDTVCGSGHAAWPDALARPALYAALGEPGPAANELKIFADVTKRVRAWKEMEPWYPDQTRGLPKTAESRGTESVINAMVLAR